MVEIGEDEGILGNESGILDLINMDFDSSMTIIY